MTMEIERFHAKLVSWTEIEEWSKEVCRKIEGEYAPDILIGLTRGGWVPTRLISDYLLNPDIASLKTEHWGITATVTKEARIVGGLTISVKGKKVLIIDDITDTGDSMALALKYLKNLEPSEVKTATLLHIEGAKIEPDYYSEFVPKSNWKWFIFPWNLHEDLFNLIPKTLYRERDVWAIAIALNEQFSIDVDPDKLNEVLSDLAHKGKIRKVGDNWTVVN